MLYSDEKVVRQYAVYAIKQINEWNKIRNKIIIYGSGIDLPPLRCVTFYQSGRYNLFKTVASGIGCFSLFFIPVTSWSDLI
jgi:hypothetical protein